MYRMQLLGFNAVRLPFSFADFSKTPNAISYGCSQVRRMHPACDGCKACRGTICCMLVWGSPSGIQECCPMAAAKRVWNLHLGSIASND